MHHAGPAADTVLGRIALPAALRGDDRLFGLHPVLLDACPQTLAAHPALSGLMLPLGCAAVRVFGEPRLAAFCWAQLTGHGERSATGDVRLLSADGTVLAEAAGVRFGGTAEPTPDRRFAENLWTVQWDQAPPPRADRVPEGPFLVLTEDAEDPLAGALSASLAQRGVVCVVQAVPLGREDGLRLDRDPAGVILLAPPGRAEEDAVEAGLARVRRLTLLVQALVGEHSGGLPRLWSVTRLAQQVPGDTGAPEVGQAGLRGMCRVLMSEHPELIATSIDIDPGIYPADLSAEFLTQAAEDEIAWRDGRRLLARLRLTPLAAGERRRRTVRFGQDGLALDSAARGSLDTLELVARRRVEPGPGEVEVRVHAASLNYMDLLNAMGVYKTVDGSEPPFGVDCAGEVVADTGSFRAGDRVAVFGTSAMASFHTGPADRLIRIPGGMSWEEAAALPAVYVTAWHALIQLARLRHGERVLIHTASGGLGLAAIGIARSVGAHIYATAGSPDKRAYLRDLGIEHVMDSRTLDFARQIREQTNGEGIDVVLNTLTGHAQRAGLELLRTGGRFIELGKKDIYAGTRLGLSPFRNNLSLHSVDLGLLLAERPQLVAEAIAEVGAELAAGRLPALPVTPFQLTEATTAFRTLAAAGHIGKLVLTIPQHGELNVPVPPGEFPLVRTDGTYAITGGLGGLGLLLARWLAGQGAAHLVLNGRSAPTGTAQQIIDELACLGTEITVILGDIADPAIAAQIAAAAGPAIRGVMHAAAVVPESPIGRLDDTLLAKGWQAKCAGARSLHDAVDGTTLDWWFNFGSAASLIGFPGLGAYAAACSWLDGFTLWQRQHGVPASTVAWGAWADHGLGQSFATRGYEMISVPEGLHACDRLLRHDRPLAGYIPAKGPVWLQSFGATVNFSFLSALAWVVPMQATPPGADNPVLTDLRAVIPEARRELLLDFISDQAATILGLDHTDIDPDRQLKDAGLDSLMALELRTRMEKGTGIRVPTKILWTNGSPTELADHILTQLPPP